MKYHTVAQVDPETGGCYKRLEGDEVHRPTGYPCSYSREGYLNVVENHNWWIAT